ncbi:MAG: hypothetical protein GTO40_15770 [Deltaproteobacteria bacterium]|nr:hypothetical protein [Deltaproteobacteria bacterium]
MITLTTDFGYKDAFVGTMKGVILGINPKVTIVDLSHGIPPQDIMAGAMVLSGAVPSFPAGTIHVAVVDPGVGSERRPILVQSDQEYFIGPDNGIFSLVMKGKKPRQTVELSAEKYHLEPKSATFHGRDVFAPVAAHLSQGLAPSKLGNPIGDLIRLPWPEVTTKKSTISGEVIYVDGFGNLVTNIREDMLAPFAEACLSVSVGRFRIPGLSSSYSTVREGEKVAVLNSWRFLEIAVRNGSAAKQLGKSVGAGVEVSIENTA